MQEIVLKLEKLELRQFDTRTSEAHFTFVYARNGQRHHFSKSFVLQRAEPLVENILKTLKALGRIEVQPGDELMGSMFVIRLLEENKTEEKLYNFFVKLCEQARTLKRITDHKEYMHLYDTMSMQQLTL